MDILFFAKEVIGFAVGIIIAFAGLTGYIGLVAYALIASFLSYVYVYKYLGVDEELIETKDVLK